MIFHKDMVQTYNNHVASNHRHVRGGGGGGGGGSFEKCYNSDKLCE